MDGVADQTSVDLLYFLLYFLSLSLLTWRRSSSAGPAGPKVQLTEGWLRHSAFPTLIGHSMII